MFQIAAELCSQNLSPLGMDKVLALAFAQAVELVGVSYLGGSSFTILASKRAAGIYIAAYSSEPSCAPVPRIHRIAW